MAGLFGRPRDETDESEVPEWMLARNADLMRRQHWLQLQPIETDDDEVPTAEPPRRVTAQRGDNISRIIGTSKPQAIARFARANGLGPGDSTIRAGSTYAIPNASDEQATDRAEGLLMIRRDNARLAELQRQREEAQALKKAQARQLGLTLDRLAPRYDSQPESDLDQGLQPEASTPQPPTGALAGRTGATGTAPMGSRPNLFSLPPSAWDKSPMARGVAGYLGQAAGAQVGLATGAAKVADGIARGGLFFGRLLNPFDTYMSDPGDAAWDHVFGGIGSAIDYGRSRIENHGLIRQDLSQGWTQFRQDHDPTATAPGATPSDELKRQYGIGKNNSELLVDVASTVAGGEGLKALSLAGKAGELTGAAKWVARGFTPAQAEYLAAPYQGMGHHFWPRRGIDIPGIQNKVKLPQFMSEGPLNLKKPGISRGDFYELHYKVDPRFYNANLPRRVGGGTWTGSRLGYDKYGQFGRIWYGSPDALKVTVGGAAATPGLLGYEISKVEE
jgi:hypothetical protein